MYGAKEVIACCVGLKAVSCPVYVLFGALMPSTRRSIHPNGGIVAGLRYEKVSGRQERALLQMTHIRSLLRVNGTIGMVLTRFQGNFGGLYSASRRPIWGPCPPLSGLVGIMLWRVLGGCNPALTAIFSDRLGGLVLAVCWESVGLL